MSKIYRKMVLLVKENLPNYPFDIASAGG